MWNDIKLIGRDQLLIKEIRPRLKDKRGFILCGLHGVGKTALLEWVAVNIRKQDVAMVSADSTVKEILVKICEEWKLEVKDEKGVVRGKSKWQVSWMEDAIYTVRDKWLLIDDIHRITPSQLRRLKILRDQVWIVAAGVPPFKKEELKRLLWGLAIINVKPLPTSAMTRIAKAAAIHLRSRTPIDEAVHAARGLPGQLINTLKGEVTPESNKTSGEEIDLAPLLLVGVAGVMIVRYIAVGIESTSLYVLGGFGMAMGLIARFYLYRGLESKRS